MTGESIKTLASAGKIFTVCCRRASDGRTSALAPLVFVSNNTLAMGVSLSR
jgi:hypothetical protein